MDGMTHDPFAAITDADRERASEIPAVARGDGTDTSDTLELLPYPGQDDPQPQSFRHGKHGHPSGAWLYRNGDLLCAVARYDLSNADGSPKLKKDGKRAKEFAPWSYGRRMWTDRKGQPRDITGWHCKAPPEPRPLYGLDRLAARPDAPVLVCEGEKAADAATVIFPDYVSIAAMNGARAPSKTDWSPLLGRTVTTWPDNDAPGAAFAVEIAALAKRAGAASVLTVDVPTGWGEGWDLADPMPSSEFPGRLRELLDGAPDGSAVELPSGFEMKTSGLWHTPEATDKNPEPPSTFVAAPFRVVGMTRSSASDDWGLLLRWHDSDGAPHQWAIPKAMVHQPGNDIAVELERSGLHCGADARAHDLLKRFIGSVEPRRRLHCVSSTGWHHVAGAPIFVLAGGEAFGRGAGNVIVQTEHVVRDAVYRTAGTLAGWQGGVAALAVGNDRLALMTSAAFAGPLLEVMSEPSGGVHFTGASRLGKTTAVIMAGSAWGRPDSKAQIRPWRGTANGLEAVAAGTSDTLLILDEIGQAESREVADTIYMLANEAGKQRATRTGAARGVASWRTLLLSTGEITLADKMGEAGKRPMAGLEVRLINLKADAGAGLGIFQNLHGRKSSAALVEEIKANALANYGAASRAFLGRLALDRADHPGELGEVLSALRERFLAQNVPDGANGQIRSVASRFALIGAAGELARDYGVLPWPAGEAMRAAGACFRAWLAERGGTSSGEDKTALAQVRMFLEAHGESRFTALNGTINGTDLPMATRTVNRAGFRRRTDEADGERWEYLILPEAWKSEICKGMDAARTADLLAARGWLLGGNERHRAARVRIPGEGQLRLYHVSGAIMEGDADGAL